MVTPEVGYTMVDREIVVTDTATGEVQWSGTPDNTEVVELLSISGTNDAVALLDYMARRGALRNLIRIGPDGTVKWRAELPTSEPSDAYVEVEYDHKRGRLTAHSWSGYWVTLEQSSGKISECHFVK